MNAIFLPGLAILLFALTVLVLVLGIVLPSVWSRRSARRRDARAVLQLVLREWRLRAEIRNGHMSARKNRAPKPGSRGED